MKRKLSLLLAVVMILGSFSFAFAADEVVPAEFLEKEGILVGNDSGDLMLDQPLLRKDAVVLLARLMKAEEEAEAFEKEGLPTFNDLADNPYYKGFLAWAEDNGYFTGKTDGSFGYADNLEAVEYALVLLRALGYVNDNKADEWDNAWTEAEKLGLLEDVKAERRDEIKREEVAQMTYNALGVTMKDSDKTLAEFLGITMPEAKELTATVKDTENLKEVVVELSNAKLADKDKLENANNYKVAGNVVEKAELDGNNVIVLLKNPLLEGREYKLRIRSIDKAINAEYKFVARDNTLPRVEEVEVLGEYGIKVVTNEPINIKDGNRGRNFLVDGKNIAMNVESYGRNIILTPYYKESFSENSKTLTITGLEDFAGFKSAREEFEIDVVKDEVAPEVVDVILRGSNKVEVVFDKDIYIESVEAYYDRNNTGNISYESGRHNVYADDAEKVDTNRVVYTFEDDLLRRRTEFTIEGVQNHSKVTMERTTMEAREVLDDTEPEIIDHKVVEKDVDNGTAKIKLYFDKDVEGNFDGDSDRYFEPNKHFTLYEREVYKRNISEDGKVDKAYYDTDGDKLVKDVIVVELIGLEGWTSTNELDYILEVEDFTDATSKRNRMYRDYVEFRITKSTGFTIEDIDVIERTYETEITIKFSKAVDRVIAEDPTNYIFLNKDDARKDVKDLKGEIVTERKGKEVTLILPDFKVADYKTLTIYDLLKDKDGNRLDNVYTYNFGKVFSGIADKANDLLEEAEEYAGVEAVDKAVEKLEALKEAGYRDIDREEILDAIKALEEALEEAKKAEDNELESAKTILKNTIAKAEKLYEENKEALAVVLNDARAVLANDEATIDEVRKATGDLQDVIDAIEAAQEAENFETTYAAVLELDVDSINDLSDFGEVTKEDIIAAKEAFNALSEDAKAKLTDDTLTEDFFTDLEAKYDELAAAQEAENFETTYAAVLELDVDSINDLSDFGEVTKEDITAAKEAFNALSEDAKAKLTDDTLTEDFFTDLEAKYDELDG